MLHTFIVPSDDTSAAALTLSPLIGRRCQLRGLAISGMTHSLAPDVPIDVPETFAKPTTSVPYRTNRTFPVPVAGAASATWDTECPYRSTTIQSTYRPIALIAADLTTTVIPVLVLDFTEME